MTVTELSNGACAYRFNCVNVNSVVCFPLPVNGQFSCNNCVTYLPRTWGEAKISIMERLKHILGFHVGITIAGGLKVCKICKVIYNPNLYYH